MNWLALVLVSTVLNAMRIFIDNYTCDVFFKKRLAVSQKLFFGSLWIVVSLIILFVSGFNPTAFDPMLIFTFFIAGFFNSFASIPYYRALEIEDSTNLGIFFQLSPLLYLILGWIFLGQTFSPIQLIAFITIISAPALIVITTRKKSRKIKLKAVFYAFLYVLLIVISNLIFVGINNENMSYIDETALFSLGSGFASVTMVYSIPKWRKRFFSVLKSSKKKVLIPMFFSTIISFIKSLAYRAALIMAPTVAFASAISDSLSPVIIFLLGLILTLIWPKFGREKLDKKTVLVHLIATILVVIGIIIIQVQNSMI